MHVRVLERFARWFASALGVWQTFFALAGWVTLEYTHVVHDDNMFELMAWLTIYSGFTQNVLAYVSTLSSQKLDQVLDHLTTSSDVDLAEDKGHTSLLNAILTEVKSLRSQGDIMSGLDDPNYTIGNGGAVITAAYTATATDSVLEWSATGAAFVLTLPAASAALAGRVYYFVQTTSSANQVTVKTAGGTINGVAAGTGVAQTASKIGTSQAWCDGTNWYMQLI
jgi:hypothetical protein